MFTKKFIYLPLILLLVLDLVLLSYWLQYTRKTSPMTTSVPNVNTFAYLEGNINDLVVKKSLDFALNSIKTAFQKGQISISQCHSLTHLAGHRAYLIYANNLEKLSGYDLILCGGAFQHGIEAEIALNPNYPVNTLRKFCQVLRARHVGTNCYHGAGHAYLGEYLDVEKSLQHCNNIVDKTTQDAYPCHEGVFSEYAFQLAGIDGDTNLPFPNGPTMKLPTPYPMDYCQSLEAKYQLACAAQLSRVLFNSTDSQNPLEQCSKNSYSDDIQFGCMRIVSAVIAQGEFTTTSTVKVPSFILSLSPNLKRAYIIGIAGEYQAFLTSGVEKDWHSICNSFIEEDDIKECEKSMNGNFDIMSFKEFRNVAS